MPLTTPFIPESITVHLGVPNSSAANVTVTFADYIKNVASSELFPTWNESALRANILSITSFALNRIYTEFYRSRGKDFDITNSTAYDQAFVNGRSVFDSISLLVDELFDDYLRRAGFVEPLAAAFCNGTTSTCDGLSQWGSEDLAQQGYNALEIVRNYYGNDIEVVQDAPIQPYQPSYPGYPLREGDSSPNVIFIQEALNRVSQNYPAIPKITPVNGVFGSITREAVLKLQSIFGLSETGEVDKSTWYQLIRLYVAVLRLAELNSEGQTYEGISWAYPDAIVLGNRGIKVSHLQYMLAVLSEFYPEIPSLSVTGVFDEATQNAVLAFQRIEKLPQSGAVNAKNWDEIYDAYAGIAATVTSRGELFPYQSAPSPSGNGKSQLQPISANAEAPATPRPVSRNGNAASAKQQSCRYQRQRSPAVSSRQLETDERKALVEKQGSAHLSKTTRFAQFPGITLSMGESDYGKEVRNDII